MFWGMNKSRSQNEPSQNGCLEHGHSEQGLREHGPSGSRGVNAPSFQSGPVPLGNLESATGGVAAGSTQGMSIDCDTCPVRGFHCQDCVVSAILGPPELLDLEQRAIAVLVDRGLVPPLRDPRSHRRREVS
jgi:hypothetical protein